MSGNNLFWHLILPLTTGLIELCLIASVHIAFDVGAFWRYVDAKIRRRALMPLALSAAMLVGLVVCWYLVHPFLPTPQPSAAFDENRGRLLGFLLSGKMPVAGCALSTGFVAILIYPLADGCCQERSKVKFERPVVTTTQRWRGGY